MSSSPRWKESIPPNEAAVFEGLATELGALQKRLSEKQGMRRALHAKPNVVARAHFEVAADVPADLRVGPFASPAKFDAVVRFSNGGPVVREDRRPDVRGIGVKLIGVPGPKLIPGLENCVTQDFLAILSEAVPFKGPEEFVWVLVNSLKPLTFLPKALVHLGPGRAFTLLSTLNRGLGQPIYPLHCNHYFSALPIQFGAEAVKYGFKPLDADPNAPSTKESVGPPFAKRLAQGPLRWAFQVQRFDSETTTPIEDPMVTWNTPWTTLGTLTLPQQDVESASGKSFSTWAENLSFDPWHAPVEFRPLGATMRARNAAYRVSTQTRGASPEPTQLPPS